MREEFPTLCIQDLFRQLEPNEAHSLQFQTFLANCSYGAAIDLLKEIALQLGPGFDGSLEWFVNAHGTTPNYLDIKVLTIYEGYRANIVGVGKSILFDHNICHEAGNFCTVSSSCLLANFIKGWCPSLGVKYSRKQLEIHAALTSLSFFAFPNLEVIRVCTKKGAELFHQQLNMSSTEGVLINNRIVRVYSHSHPSHIFQGGYSEQEQYSHVTTIEKCRGVIGPECFLSTFATLTNQFNVQLFPKLENPQRQRTQRNPARQVCFSKERQLAYKQLKLFGTCERAYYKYYWKLTARRLCNR